MTLEPFAFYLFASALLISGLMVILLRNPVHAVLSLVLAFFSSAGLWMMLHAEFLAILLVLIYVGAVMVLFLFVVMMLDINLAVLREGFIRYLPVGATVAVLMATGMIFLLLQSGASEVPPVPGVADEASNVQQIGELLFTEYLYPFEIAGALLLLAILAVISMTERGLGSKKSQDPAWQVQARPEDRIRLVSMDSES